MFEIYTIEGSNQVTVAMKVTGQIIAQFPINHGDVTEALDFAEILVEAMTKEYEAA
jgi:uncharacterized protein (DUF433 family)